MPVLSNVLEAIGGTPLVRLNRLVGDNEAQVLAKLEFLNPSGSIKAGAAYGMITAAEKAGLLNKDSIIVEPTSGNQGIGLAMVAAVKGYRAIIVMPETMSVERRKLVAAFGAEIRLTTAGRNIQETFDVCINEARRMAAVDPRVFIPQQFENPANPAAHRDTTAQEILEQVDGPIDAFVAGIGTGGTLTGVGEVLKKRHPKIRVVAAEPANAAILSGGKIGSHIQQGIGDGLIPKVLNRRIIDEIVQVTDEEAVEMARLLARKEGLLAGVSSGTAAAASLKIARQLGPGKTVVTILPDTGERYLSMDLW